MKKPSAALFTDGDLTPSGQGRVALPGRLLAVAHQRLRAELVKTLRGAGCALSGEEWSVLSALRERGSLSQLEVGALAEKDRHHTSRLIDGLQAAGLVIRSADAHDKRLSLVALTSRGRAMRSRLRPLVGRSLAKPFAGVSPRDFAGFVRCLEHLVRTLEPSVGR